MIIRGWASNYQSLEGALAPFNKNQGTYLTNALTGCGNKYAAIKTLRPLIRKLELKGLVHLLLAI
jgi:hypothetical protein